MPGYRQPNDKHRTMNKQAIPAGKWAFGSWVTVAANGILAIWFLSLLDTHFLREIGGSLHSFGSTWGDLPWHLSIIMGFVERGWGSLFQDPVYAGAKLVYPFLPEVLPGLLVKAGLSMRSALIATTWPFLVLLTSLLSLLSYRITRSAYVAALAPLLFCLTGSVVGTYHFLRDVSASGSGILSSFWTVGQSYANAFDRGLHFTNTVADFLLPQRTIVFGLVLGLSTLLLLWSYWSRGSRKSLLWAGLCTGLLPLWHTHSFVALCIITGTLCLVDMGQSLVTHDRRALTMLQGWALHFVILSILAIPQLLLVLPENGSSFLRWQVGWLGRDGWLGFWLKNLGAYFFLIPGALVATWWHERKDTKDDRAYPIATFYLGFLAVFVVVNLVVFQPWDWDNMKLLLWWFLGSIVLILHAGVLLVRYLGTKARTIRFPAYAVLAIVGSSLISTGLLAARYESGKSVELFSPADRGLADFIMGNTPADAVFLTSERHNHPVTTLAGRRIYLGYGGWLWSHGIDATKRTDRAKRMLAGQPGTMELLRQERIAYVVLESGQPGANAAFFEANAEQLFANASFILYAIR